MTRAPFPPAFVPPAPGPRTAAPPGRSAGRPAPWPVARAPLLFLCLTALVFPVGSGAGQARLSVAPVLGPYYRPGKYIPVRVTADLPDLGRDKTWVVLASESVRGKTDIPAGSGRTAVELPRAGRLDAVLPWLVMDQRAGRPRVFLEDRDETVLGPPLRRLDDSERLVGWTAPDEAFARQLLGPGARLIPVQLDPSRPLPGTPAAWESLDAVILDAGSAARLGSAQLAGLLACGVTVAVKVDPADPARPGPGPPLPGWPWQRAGAYRVLRHAPAGPVTAGYHPDAFKPVLNWDPGWRWSVRRRLLLVAVAVAVPFLGLALWRPPLAWLWALLLSAGTMVVLGKWWSGQLLLQQAAGEVIVVGPGLTQTDAWTYVSTTQARESFMRWSEAARPVYAGRAGMDDVWISLNCDTDGRPYVFHIRLPAGRRFAFVARTVGPRAPSVRPDPQVTSPLGPMVQTLYTADAGRTLGQLPPQAINAPQFGYTEATTFPAVVVERE